MNRRLADILILVVAWILPIAQGSGVSTHLLILSRTHSFLPHNIQGRDSSLHCGAFFPDSFYNCLGLSDVAEDTHWPPFLLEAAKYYREKYSKRSQVGDQVENADSLTDKGADLKAFLYGIFTHQIADSTWHSLRMNDGLLKHLAAMEFSGNIEQAHTYLDTAVDYLLLKQLSKASGLDKGSYIEDYFSIKWEIPVSDLINIYQRLGYSQVNSNNMMHCVQRGNIGLQLELKSYELTWPVIIGDSPYSDDIFDSYFLGGLEEIETTIAKCLINLSEWLDNEELNLENIDSWSLCPGKIIKPGEFAKYGSQSENMNTVQQNKLEVDRKSVRKTGNYNQDNKIFVSPFIKNSRFGHDIIVGKFLGDNQGIYAAISAPFEDSDGSIYLIPLNEMKSLDDQNISVLSIKGFQNSNYNAKRYGYALEKLVYTISADNMNERMFEFLVVAAPGEQKVYIYYGSKQMLSISFPKEYKQIGINLMNTDINQDGIPDLIISTPFANFSKRTGSQNGVVIIFDGREILSRILDRSENLVHLGIQKKIQNHLTLQLSLKDQFSNNLYFKDLKPKTMSFPKSFVTSDNIKGFQNFGTSVASNDKYLFISMRSTGTVFIYRKSGIMENEIEDVEPIFCLNYGEDPMNEGCQHERVKSSKTGQFGSRFMAAGNEFEFNWVVISAHSESYESCMLCGSIYLYVFQDNLKTDPVLISKIILKDSSEFSKFGYKGTVINQHGASIVFISAPTFKRNTGAVFSINITEILKKYILTGDYATTDIGDPSFLGPSETYSGFGNALSSFIDEAGQQKLLVGASSYGYSDLVSDSKKLTGLAIMYEI